MRYAAYGSNLHPHRLRIRVPSASLVGVAVVPDWQLKFHKRSKDGSGKCNVIESDESVFFALFDIDARQKNDLDRAEGLGFGYEQRSIEIQGFGECFSYVASDSHIQEGLKPYSWYKDLVMVGLEYHEAPEEYLTLIRATAHRMDLDEARHRQNMQIVVEARNGT